MKILHVINNMVTGGAEKLLLDTIPLFNVKNCQVDLLLIDGTDYPYLKKLKEFNNCNIYYLNSKNIYSPLNIFRIIPFLRKYDLLHVHLFPAQYWVAFAKLISFSNTKLVFTEHSTSNRRMENRLFRLIDKQIYKIYHKVVCISSEIKKVLMLHANLNESKLVIVENGINLDLFNRSAAIKKNSIDKNLCDNDIVLIQVAGFRYQKDQVTTVKSLQYLPINVKLVLVGDGEFKEDLKKLVDDLNLIDRVFFLGIRLDVPVLMKSSDIVVISSHWEGMPLSVIEGMAAKKPVVASNVAGVTQLVDGFGILFEKGNEIELAEKIKTLLVDDIYYRKIAERGFERAKKYDINCMVDQQINLYKELLK
ncbi:glycosyltransferase [Flavobacterium sp. N2038]|uniref:glycosyltransferase n=1 Tax=Flavobacterium sp. N2038 TaxID=2986829 RepID=UPI0022259F5D|nr:glycosyltransferase [Flavobacterium sp. N2038]